MACCGNFSTLTYQLCRLLIVMYSFISSMAFGSKDPLGLELDIRVPDEDISSLDSDLRPEFVEGMNCNVPGCSSRSFNSVNTLWKHWKKVHRGTIPLFRCSACSFKAGDSNLIKKHAKSVHKASLDKSNIEVVIRTIYLQMALCVQRREQS